MTNGRARCCVLLLLSLCACSAADEGPATTTSCGANLKPYKTACVPMLDECPGDHVPVPGGGCKRVGVEECTVDGAPGIKSPPDWTCERIGPECRPGWLRVKDGHCEPDLPDKSCPGGMMEVMGKKDCQPVGDCGSGKWGNIKLLADTLFVDGSYGGGDGDGSQAKPFPTINEALKATKEGGHVVVAEGTYSGAFIDRQGLTLEGRCPAKVKIVFNGFFPAVRIEAEKVKLRGFTVTSTLQCGVWVQGGSATLEDLVVERCGGDGIVGGQGSIELRRVLSAGNTRFGVYLNSADAEIHASLVRETLPYQGSFGNGVHAENGSSVVIQDSVFVDNQGAGIQLVRSGGTVKNTLVTGNKRVGISYSASDNTGQVAPVKLEVSHTVVADNPYGIITDGEAVFENMVVRDGAPDRQDSGILVRSSKNRPGSAMIRRSLILRNALVALEAPVDVDRTVVTGTRISPDTDSMSLPAVQIARATGKITRSIIRDNKDTGLMVYDQASLVLEDCRVSGNRDSGVRARGASAALRRTIIERTTTRGGLGFGVYATPGDPSLKASTLAMEDSVVSGSPGAGLGLGGTKATILRSVIRDGAPVAKSDYGNGIQLVAVESLRSSLELRDSVLAGNFAAAAWVVESDARVERSVIRKTRAQPVSESWGDGLVVGLFKGGKSASLDVSDCLVDGNARAGVLFYRDGGSVRRSLFRDNTFAVALEEAADPTIEDNVYEDNTQNGLTIGENLQPPPPPVLPP
jgi:hypothetical protein